MIILNSRCLPYPKALRLTVRRVTLGVLLNIYCTFLMVFEITVLFLVHLTKILK